MAGLSAVVANTDRQWFDYLRPIEELRTVDEVNFWRPSAQSQFRALEPGEPFFLRLKAPVNAIAGFGFFAAEAAMSVSMAWEVFGDKNGDPNRERFESRIIGYRQRLSGLRDVRSARLSCLILRNVVFLPSNLWVPWGTAEDWSSNIVSYRGYDITAGPGVHLSALMRSVPNEPAAELVNEFRLVSDDTRALLARQMVARDGQGTFRVRLLNAYGGQCAVTREHSTPVLDAAHIQPYLGPSSNHVQNGLVLRSDLHRLFDEGYVTVTPELRLEVSNRLREDFENGKTYYAMAGSHVWVPEKATLRPSSDALRWHADHVYR